MRESRKNIAEATLQELKQGYYINRPGSTISFANEVEASIQASFMFRPADLEGVLKDNPTSKASYNVSLVSQSTISCLINMSSSGQRIAILNFASAKNPGGGFLGGSQAQEESLARSSSLYPSLLSLPEFYSTNRKSADAFYTNNLIYSPSVVFFKNDAGEHLDNFVTADVITMPAVNKGALKQVNESIEEKIEFVMKQRIRYVLAASVEHNVDILILGAWGCGVFRNDPKDISRYFKQVLLELPGLNIHSIVFAIIGSDTRALDAFSGIETLT